MSNIYEKIEKIQKGDLSSWNELDSVYRPKLTKFCRKWFPNTEDCEEAVQEIMLLCYRKLDQLDDPKMFDNWIYTVARNKCNEIVNKNNRAVSTVTVYTDEGEVSSAISNIADEGTESNIEESYEHTEQFEVLKSILDKLPEEQQFCFVQRVLYDMPFKKIAELSGISESTVKSRYNYAKKALKNHIADYEKKNNTRLHRGLFILPVPIFRKAIQKKALAIFFIGGATASNVAVLSGITVATVGVIATLTATVLPAINNSINSSANNNSIPQATEVVTDAQGNTYYVPVTTQAVSNTQVNSSTSFVPTQVVTDAQGNTHFVPVATQIVTDAQGNTHIVTVPATTQGDTSASTSQTEPVESTEPTEPIPDDPRYTYEIDENGNAVITSFTDTSGNDFELVIPKALGGKTVTRIGNDVFSGQNHITKLTLPDTLTELGESAFRGCTGLKELEIPGSIKTIPYAAFISCNSLEKIVLDEGVEEIMMYGITSTTLKEVYLPSTLKFVNALGINVNEANIYVSDLDAYLKAHIATPLLDQNKLYYNGRLVTDVVLPKGLKTLNESLAYYPYINSIICNSDLEALGSHSLYNISPASIKLNKGLKEIEVYAFQGIVIDKLEIPDTVESIDEGAFAGAEINTLTLPKNLNEISNRVFESSKIKSITLPANIKKIGDMAFMNSSITQLTIPDGVESIGSRVFYNCTELTTLRLGGNLNEIGSNAFYGTSKLTIQCPKGSATEELLKNNGIKYTTY